VRNLLQGAAFVNRSGNEILSSQSAAEIVVF
jgi:hypothetical protein